MSPESLSKRPVVLVTGAGLRIGNFLAQVLSERGWAVAVHYRNSRDDAQQLVSMIRSKGGSAEVFQANLEIEDEVIALGPHIINRMGRWDALVNNASLFQYDSIDSFTFSCMERHWRTNTAAPIILANTLSTHLRQRGVQGCVVNLLDQKLWNPNPDYLSYTLSKAALETATTLLAQALAPNLRVCGVAPGLTLKSDLIADEDFEALHRLSPINRSSTPADIANAVHFLLSNPAVTGTTLLVDGGQHLMKFDRDFPMLKK